jgi:small subunit ribosomal protein S6
MSNDPILYDLVLLLSLESEDEARAKIVADTEASITSAGGTVTLNQEWGQRPTTFQINHQSEAEYHLLQFTGPTALLESLSHTLRIADEVLRFRIIKAIGPASESVPPVVAAGATAEAPVVEGEVAA